MTSAEAGYGTLAEKQFYPPSYLQGDRAKVFERVTLQLAWTCDGEKSPAKETKANTWRSPKLKKVADEIVPPLTCFCASRTAAGPAGSFGSLLSSS